MDVATWNVNRARLAHMARHLPARPHIVFLQEVSVPAEVGIMTVSGCQCLFKDGAKGLRTAAGAEYNQLASSVDLMIGDGNLCVSSLYVSHATSVAAKWEEVVRQVRELF